MSRWVKRSQWGARAPRRRARLSGSHGLGVHYNGPPMGLVGGCGDGSRCAQAVRDTQRFHMDPKPRGRGWADGAYSFCVCPSCGRIYVMRGWGVRTAANGTNAANGAYHAVMVLVGGSEPFTDAACRSVLAVSDEHARRYNHSALVPHSTFKATGCPGHPGRAWLSAGAPHPGGSPSDPEPEPDSDEEETMERGDSDSGPPVIEHWQHFANRFLYETRAMVATHDVEVIDDLGSDVYEDRDGYVWSNLKADGQFGPLTQRATWAVRERAGLILGYSLPGRQDVVTPTTQSMAASALAVYERE